MLVAGNSPQSARSQLSDRSPSDVSGPLTVKYVIQFAGRNQNPTARPNGKTFLTFAEKALSKTATDGKRASIVEGARRSDSERAEARAHLLTVPRSDTGRKPVPPENDSAREEHTAAEWAATNSDCGDLGRTGHLAIARSAAQLRTCFVEKTVAVQAAGRELAAVAVERKLAVERDAPASLDEAATLSFQTNAQCFEPYDRQKAETVVELRDINVVRLKIGSRPEHRGRVARGHGRQIIELIPRRAAAQTASYRFNLDRGCTQVACRLARRHDDCGAAVDGDIAIIEAERVGDHASRQVIIHGERTAKDCLGISC